MGWFQKGILFNLTRQYAWADNSPTDYFDRNTGSTCKALILMDDTGLVAYYSFTADAFVNYSSGYGRTLIPSASSPSHNSTHCLWGSGCSYFAETISNFTDENKFESFALGPRESGLLPNLSICYGSLLHYIVIQHRAILWSNLAIKRQRVCS